MQEVKKYINGYGYDSYEIKTDTGTFEMLFAPNGDLYWRYLSDVIPRYGRKKQEIIITKENYFVYEQFYILYESIKNNKAYCDKNDFIEVDKRENKLFKNGAIEWYSDELPKEIASKLTIKKEKDIFRVTFEKSKKEVDGINFTYSIRFRNSGSRYNPFNIAFMYMYHNFKQYDEDNLQMHIEECLYLQKTLKKKKKTD